MSVSTTGVGEVTCAHLSGTSRPLGDFTGTKVGKVEVSRNSHVLHPDLESPRLGLFPDTGGRGE